tara:strand:- start:67 stop:1692 length:1626 start_codon:yes stop_codon:yes gene_type:complete
MGKDNMMNYDKPFEENKLPFGSLEEEVADDIPVMLSEGEYVVPADVVRYWGLKHLEEMRMMAKCGLMSMQQDGRLHKVDEDGEPVETEAQNEPQLEIVEVDIQAMQDDMSDQEEEEENDMDKQMELFEDNVIEVDFDGKDEEDIEDDDNILKLQEGGGFEQQQNFGLGMLGGVALNISPDLMSRSLADIGVISPDNIANPGTIAMDASLQDTANTLGSDKQQDLADSIVNNAFDDANKATGVQGILGFAGRAISNVANTVVPFSPFDVATTKTVALFNDVYGNPVNTAIGATKTQQTVAKAAMKDLVDIGLNISKGVQSPTDLGVLGGQVVGISVSDLAGIPTQSLTGTVPTQMDVSDYDKAVASMLGVDIATVGINDVTGRPDYSVATDLIGVDTDPVTGMATTGGYTQTGSYQDMFGNVSALGTVSDLDRLGTQELSQLGKQRGFTGFLGLDKKSFDEAMDKAEKREQQQYDYQAGGVMGATDPPTGEPTEAGMSGGTGGTGGTGQTGGSESMGGGPQQESEATFGGDFDENDPEQDAI